MADRSIDALAVRAASGEPGAFDALVRATWPGCWALARRLSQSDADAADVVQDAYLRAYRAIRRFRADSSVETWLYRIVANAAASAHRRGRRHLTSPLPFDLDLVDRTPERDPEVVLDRSDARSVVIAALRELPFGLRSVIVLRDVYDLSHEAIASELGISAGAAKVRLHRARRQLRAALDPTVAGRSVPSRRAAQPPSGDADESTGGRRADAV